jgi:uncharacterized membrane protein YbhN (UPF0104 family)
MPRWVHPYVVVGARVAALAGLVTWGLASLDLRRVFKVLANVEPRWAVASATVLLAGQALSALRWQAAAPPQTARPTRWFMATYFRGCFYNAFLPTGIGGDAARMLAVHRAGAGKQGVRAVVLDRVGGLILVALIAAVLLPFSAFADRTGASIAAAAVAVTVVICAWLALSRRGHARWLPLGLLYVAIWSAGLGLLAGSLGISVGFLDLPAVILVTGIAMAIPLSIGGLGTREAGFVFALTPLGIPAAHAVALGLAFGLALIVVSLPGLPLPRTRMGRPEVVA